MKKILAIVACCLTISAYSQRKLQKAIHNYYRYDPFERSFSNFISNLINDPALTNKTIVKRTDSTFFFFKGEYKDHNPFGFKAIRTEVRLAEMEVQRTDSIPKNDTIMAYQIIGYTYKTGNGIQSVKSEFARFDRKYGDDFADKATSDLLEGGHVEGMTCNYFLNNSNISPLTITWGNVSNGESVFVVTIRLIKIENQAMLPVVYNGNLSDMLP